MRSYKVFLIKRLWVRALTRDRLAAISFKVFKDEEWQIVDDNTIELPRILIIVAIFWLRLKTLSNKGKNLI